MKSIAAPVLCATLLVAVASTAATAETALPDVPLRKDSRLSRYLVDREMQGAMYSAAHLQDTHLHLLTDCKADVQILPKQIIVLEAIDLPDNAPDPVKGTWQVRYERLACADRKLYNLVIAAAASGKPQIVAYFPGDTLVSTQLGRDAMPKTAALAAARVGDAGCKEQQVIVADTHVDRAPQRVQASNQPSGTFWTETWTLDVCGHPIDARMSFVTTSDGGTDWHAAFPAPIGRGDTDSR